MGRPPLCLCVVRHGNRLDAADRRWHLTSPTPYDPPLTYGGWLQSRALGIRISEVLRKEIDRREKLDAARNSGPTRKRKRYQVVIHSSPFLRCIQTAIALSSGVAQKPLPVPDCPCSDPNPTPTAENPEPLVENHRPVRPHIQTNFINEPSKRTPSFQKSILRLDACFGEWLSPEYFEMITPPPSSVMMLCNAKAELLRREDYKSYAHFHVHTNSTSSSSHLWTSPFTPAQNSVPSSLEDLSPLDDALPPDEAPPASSQCRARRNNVDPAGYEPPTLSYSTSKNGPIPQGLIPHARDQCLEFDYQWDSTREPLEWGDGGSYGEEWTAMHKRFRKGLQSLVDWYTTAENPAQMVTKTVKISSNSSECAVDDEEEDCETFVVIVSHGAGCNALIGAITRKPVLMDVGLASLTLAVRKDDVVDSFTENSSTETGGKVALNEAYDLKIFASTEHTRPSTSTTPSQSRSASMASVFNGNRGRFSSGSFSSAGNFSHLGSSGDSRSSSANAAFPNYRGAGNGNQSVSVPRTPSIANGFGNCGITVGSGVTSFAQPEMTPSGLSRSPSIGLWSPFQPMQWTKDDETNDDDGDDMVLNFGLENQSPKPKGKAGPSPLSNITTHTEDAESEAATSGTETDSSEPLGKPELSLGAGAGGLWGNPSPRPPGLAERLRDMTTTKRRWTVNERST